MNEYRVPTVQVEAEVRCTDGCTLTGVFFMPVLSAVHAGRMQPAEWINGRQAFFPFRLAALGGSVLVNKHQVVSLCVPRPAEEDESRQPSSEVPVRSVVVSAGGRTYEGRVLIDMPANQQRVVDYLNRDEAFLQLHADACHYFLNKDHVVVVTETEEA